MLNITAACDKVYHYQLLAHGRWFSPASCTTKTGRHDIAEILLKVALKDQKSNQFIIFNCLIIYHFGRWGRENLRTLKITGLNSTNDGDGLKYIYMDRDEQTQNTKMMRTLGLDKCMKFKVYYQTIKYYKLI
jgi:hypothetical protein